MCLNSIYELFLHSATANMSHFFMYLLFVEIKMKYFNFWVRLYSG